MSSTPVMIPDMPVFKDLERYLGLIDSSKVYSNFGKLHFTLLNRLAEYFAIESDNICLVGNATLAMFGILSIEEEGSRNTVELPSFTFTATAAAAKLAKRSCLFIDVDSNCRSIPTRNCRTVLDVLPFGSSLRHESWYEEFEFVLIDAAASFDSLKGFGEHFKPKKNYALVVSLHSTKLIGAGEGGVVISNNMSLIKKMKQWSNFGFDTSTGTRESTILGINAKMSEYSCAVALASMDLWPSNKLKILGNTTLAKNLSSKVDLKVHEAMNANFATPYWIIFTEESKRLQELGPRFSTLGIETRKWWASGCHKMPAYLDIPRESLDYTEFIAENYLGLPFHNFLTDKDWEKIELSLNE